MLIFSLDDMERLCKIMEGYGVLWKFMKIYGELWKVIEPSRVLNNSLEI